MKNRQQKGKCQKKIQYTHMGHSDASGEANLASGLDSV